MLLSLYLYFVVIHQTSFDCFRYKTGARLPIECWLVISAAFLILEIEIVKALSKKRSWTSGDVKTLKSLAKQRTKAGKIAKTLKRTEGATRQKAFSLGISLDARV